jgi:hypothetical protein
MFTEKTSKTRKGIMAKEKNKELSNKLKEKTQ